MQIQDNKTGRLAEMEVRLAQARVKAANARVELKKAERRSDRADEAVAAWRHVYDIERLRLWGDQPDVAALLESDGSMALYTAGQELAVACGLGWGMKWGDTNQTVLHIRLNRGEAGGVDRAKTAVLYFAPFIKTKEGLKRFGVHHRELSDFAVELRYSMKTGAAQVVRLHYGREDNAQSFTTLEGALTYIQEHHWIEDIIEMQTSSAMLTLEA